MNIRTHDHLRIIRQGGSIDSEALFSVYRHVFGMSAVSLYAFLFHHAVDYMHELIRLCNTSADEINQDFEQLQRAGLAEIEVLYGDIDDYLITIKPCLSIAQFIRHELYGRLLIHRCGEDVFRYYQNRTPEVAKEGYIKLQASPIELLKNYQPEEEKLYRATDFPVRTDLNFDIRGFLAKVSYTVFPEHCRSHEVIESIKALGASYGLSVDEMIRMVGKSYIEKDKQLNLEKLTKLANRHVQKDIPEVASIYDHSPVIFLKVLREDTEPTALEKASLYRLVHDSGMNPRYLNAVVEALYQRYHKRIVIPQIESVALQLKALKPASLEEAKALIQQSLTSVANPCSTPVQAAYSDYVSEDVSLDERELDEIKAAFASLEDDS